MSRGESRKITNVATDVDVKAPVGVAAQEQRVEHLRGLLLRLRARGHRRQQLAEGDRAGTRQREGGCRPRHAQLDGCPRGAHCPPIVSQFVDVQRRQRRDGSCGDDGTVYNGVLAVSHGGLSGSGSWAGPTPRKEHTLGRNFGER